MLVKGLELDADERKCFGGVDVGPTRHFPCVVDLERRVLDYPHTPLAEAECVRWLRERRPAVVAIGAPPRLNAGLVSELYGEPPLRRLAERCLLVGGCYGVPQRAEELCGPRSFMASGMALYRALAEALDGQVDLGGGDGRLLETQPALAFRALCGHADSAEGRMQLDPRGLLGCQHTQHGRRGRIELLRQGLHELGLDVDRWVDRWARRIDWADATVAALVAAWRVHRPADVVQLGDEREGSITLRLADWSAHLPRPAPAVRSVAAVPAAGPQEESHKGPPPSRRGARPAAAGWLLRLDGARGGGLSQSDVAAVLGGELSQQGETWLPLRARTVTLGGLEKSVAAGHCDLALFFESRVKAVLEVREVRGQDDGELGWHQLTGHEDNPWYADGEPVASAAHWLRVANLRELELAPEGFETGRKDGSYGPGLPQRASALVRWREKAG